MPKKTPTWNEDLDDALGFLIADTARHAKRLLYARIADHGIRGGSWYLLRALWEQDGLTQREIALRLGITEPSVQEVLRSMEADGLVERTRDAVDRRKIRVCLTPKAHDLKRPLMTVAESLTRTNVTGLTEAEDVLLKRLLKTVRGHFAQQLDALTAVDAENRLRLDQGEETSVAVPTPAPRRRRA